MRKNSYPGTFIVVEGPDASGKQTQVERLSEWLRESNVSEISEKKEEEIISRMPGKYPDPDYDKVEDSLENGVWRLSFPTYHQTPGGRVVNAYLQEEFGNRDELSTQTIVDIYAADRKQFKQTIAEYLSAGGIIVADRYREANLIHQLVDFEGEEWNEKLRQVKAIDADLPDADTVFYIDVSVEESVRRMSDKEKDIHELDDSYMKKANENGRKVAKDQGWNIIDGERSKKAVTEDLKEKIRSLT